MNDQELIQSTELFAPSTVLILCLVWNPAYSETPSDNLELKSGSMQLASDVVDLCETVLKNYMYFESREAHWNDACKVALADAKQADTGQAGLEVFEHLIDELHDNHVSLGRNSALSPRLVPSGTNIWVEKRGGDYVVTAVRTDSVAASRGVQIGDHLISINGIGIQDAALSRIRTGLGKISEERMQWAINAAVAGYRGIGRIATLARNGSEFEIDLGHPYTRQKTDLLDWRRLSGNVGYIRINNSLGNTGTVAAFDSAMESLKGVSGWIIDLRDTPGGGNTSVAEPIMGRFIAINHAYQRIIPPDRPAYDRVVRARGPWTATEPIVVLVGRWTGSMGEGMAIGFDGMQRGNVIGSDMARLAGGTEAFTLAESGIPVWFPTYDLAHLNGTQRHRWSPMTIVVADNGNDSDNALCSALAWLGL